MNQLKHGNIVAFDLLFHLLKQLENKIIRDGMTIDSSQMREDFHLLSLVVNKLGLLFLSTDVLELSSDNRVSQRDENNMSEKDT